MEGSGRKGLNLTSSFHVIGTVLDRVYPEGSLTSTDGWGWPISA
jgi:hypothetical protein